MDPNTPNTSPSFDLPMPSPEKARESMAMTPNTPETPVHIEPGSVEQPGSGGSGPDPAAALPPAIPAPATQLATSPAATQPSTANDANPPIADDADLIEKEWVTKAKAIVESTKNDPRTQNREINKVKADYIKKRYNRDIKVAEE